MVLSQLRTFTVASVTSITMPSTSFLGILIQSPTFSMLLAESCTPLTKPMILSLNTSIATADNALSPASSERGSLSISTLMIIITPTHHSTTWTVCSSPFKGRFLKRSISLYTLYTAFKNAWENHRSERMIST